MRGAAPQSCNLNVKKGQPSFVPILFQMFRKYDSHLLFKTVISKSPSYINCKPLPTTIEIFTSSNYGCLVFLDSFRH